MLKPRHYRRELANEHSRARSRHQDPARRARDADALVQHPGGPAVSGKPAITSRHEATDRSARPRPTFPHGADQAGGLAGAIHRHSEPGAGRTAAMAANTADARQPVGAGVEDDGEDLLQVRRRQSGRLAQAEHGGGAGVLQQSRGHQTALDRNRSRAVGERAGVCQQALRPRMHDLYGPHQLRAEALPQEHDARLGRRSRPEPV